MFKYDFLRDVFVSFKVNLGKPRATLVLQLVSFPLWKTSWNTKQSENRSLRPVQHNVVFLTHEYFDVL
jgi:hypothetical protein